MDDETCLESQAMEKRSSDVTERKMTQSPETTAGKRLPVAGAGRQSSEPAARANHGGLDYREKKREVERRLKETGEEEGGVPIKARSSRLLHYLRWRQGTPSLSRSH
ncbi:hypothetical protein L484_000675 [Morus notabilis]|uniref:Uncharacterized protein n=1 Tax=Morus notabilis TaxID=981085 RepID=W9SDA7_9ROSA|nr:hypothetical protein L484_000675 [Morus notabilis]